MDLLEIEGSPTQHPLSQFLTQPQTLVASYQKWRIPRTHESVSFLQKPEQSIEFLCLGEAPHNT